MFSLKPRKSSLLVRLFLFSLGSLMLASCADTKKLVYFDEVQDATLQVKNLATEAIIQKGDLLSITVTSLNPEASAIFNAPNESTPVTSSVTANSNTLTVGYLVNQSGDIQFPILGAVHAAGLDKYQLTNLLTSQIKERKLLLDPIVTIRYLNFRVSVLGEVTRPGVYSTPNEKLSLLEALSFAGDITIYGKRDNVLLIRDNEKGERMVKRLDLTSQEFLSSNFYYLHSNDIVYVEPSKNRVAKERNAQIVPVVLSVISLIIITITSFR